MKKLIIACLFWHILKFNTLCFFHKFGKGKMLGTGWVKNTKGKWVLTCTGGAKKPETMFYIDRTFTKLVKKTRGIKFKNVPKQTSADEFLHSRGYFKKGDTHENIGKVATFLYKNFPAYTSQKALGNYFGNYLYKSVKEFQRRTNLVSNGQVDKRTLAKLKEYGFKY